MEPKEILDIYDVIAEFYDHVVPYQNRQDIDFFVEMARESGGPVLEIGCGTGRVLIPTARAGVEIVGLDLSRSMLAFCRKKLAQEPEEVRAKIQLVEGDMCDFDLGREFNLVTTPFRPFQHLAAIEDQMACLKRIHRHLASDGTFVLDIFNPYLKFLADEEIMKNWQVEPEFTMPDGRKVIRRARNLSQDKFNQYHEVELSHLVTYPDGREEEFAQHFRMRYFFRFEVEHLLARTGFEVEHLYADYDKSPLGSKDPGELIFVARKI